MAIDSKKFKEAPKIHKEIVELEKRLAEKKQELAEKKEVEKHEKELIKEIIKEKVEKPAPPKVKPVTTPPAQRVIVKKAKELKGEQKERQIQLLTELAFEKGVVHATEVAKKLDSPYILDEFHDTLVDELYNYLVEKGKLKQL